MNKTNKRAKNKNLQGFHIMYLSKFKKYVSPHTSSKNKHRKHAKFLAITNQALVFTAITVELNEILQGLAIGMYVSRTLIYQASTKLIAGLSAFPCGGLFNYQL